MLDMTWEERMATHARDRQRTQQIQTAADAAAAHEALVQQAAPLEDAYIETLIAGMSPGDSDTPTYTCACIGPPDPRMIRCRCALACEARTRWRARRTG